MLKRSFKTSFPILLAYLPWGVAFGLLFQTLGLPWYFATLNALIIYAGAAQFVSVSLLAAGAPLTAFFTAALVINFRHLFYSFSFIPKYSSATRSQRFLLAATLTDETYSLIAGQDTREMPDLERNRFYLMVSLINYAYWVLGCTAGALMGSLLHIKIDGLDFITTAMFSVMTIDQWRRHKRWQPLLIAVGTTAIAALISQKQLLALAMGMATLWVILDYHRHVPRSAT